MNESPKRFERFSRDLMSFDDGIINPTLFGINGQAQYGIDVIGDLPSKTGRVVGSCKCYASITAGELKQFSNDFLQHRVSKWPDVKRFILITAAENLSDTKVLDQRRAEESRFAAHGLDYEVWGPDELTQRVQRAGRATAVRFLGPPWADALFGVSAPGELTATGAAQIHRLQLLLSRQADARIARARYELAIGDYVAVRRVVDDLQDPNQWTQLQPETQAAVTRLEAGIAIARQDFTQAFQLAERAQAIHSVEPRQLARIVAKMRGPVAGLAALGQPISREGRQVQASMLLEARRLDDANVVVTGLLDDDADDPESIRIQALLHLRENKRVDALRAAESAYRRGPNMLGIKRALGVALYANALSPHAESDRIWYVNPIDVSMVRADDNSRALLQRALACFAELCGLEYVPVGDRVWRLACLVALGRQEEARETCVSILGDYPNDPLAILWGLSHGLLADPRPYRESLGNLYGQGLCTAEQVRLYAAMISEQLGPGNVPDVLAQHVQVAPEAARASDECLKVYREGARPEPSASLVFAEGASASPSPGSPNANEMLVASLVTAPTVVGLLHAGELARAGRWGELGLFVDAIAGFETAPAIRLAAYVMYNTGRVADIVPFLDRQRCAFPRAQLPLDLRRMEAKASFETQRLQEAVRLATVLAAETGEPADRLFLAECHLASGNAEAALPAIRDGLSANHYDAARALQFSVHVSGEDTKLAQALWSYADSKGFPEELVATALTQAFRLGLDERTGALVRRLHARAIAGAGDVWLVDIDQILRQAESHRERTRRVSDLLASGAIPIHIAMASLGSSLPDLFDLRRRSKSRAGLSPLFIRYGARPLGALPSVPWDQWRLHLDITGLLIADQLDLLVHINALEKPVTISRHVPGLLYTFERDAGHQQARRVEIARSMLRARDDGRLRIQDEFAPEEMLVRHERKAEGVSGPTVPEMLHALRMSGATVSGAAETLSPHPFPALGRRLVFLENTLETVAMACPLEEVLQLFQCEIQQETLDELLRQLAVAEAGASLSDTVRELRVRVGRALEAGRFILTDHVSSDDGDDTHGPLVGALFDAVQSAKKTDTVVWVDDRYVNGFQGIGEAPVVGVVEVMNALVSAGRLSEAERSAKLAKLRSAGAAFIPLTRDEVLVGLGGSRTDAEGRLVETPTLSALRRSFASSQRLEDKLNVGARAAGTIQALPGEAAFALSSRRLLDECLRAVWEDVSVDEKSCRARSDWLWASLRMDRPVRRSDSNGQESTARDEFGPLWLAALFISAVRLDVDGPSEMVNARRREYVTWLDETALSRLCSDDEDPVLEAVSAQLKKALLETQIRREVPKEGLEAAWIRMRRLFLDLLPMKIVQRILRDPKFVEAAGVRTEAKLVLGGVQVSTREFWDACVRALRTGHSVVDATNGQLALARADEMSLQLSGVLSGRIKERFFPVLAALDRDRAQAFDSFLDELDLEQRERNQLASRTVAAAHVDELVDVLQDAMKLSVSCHYAQLREQVLAARELQLSWFTPPSPLPFLAYLRLSSTSGSIADRVEEAWTSLTKTFGAREALSRLAGLPVPLGDFIARGVTDASSLAELSACAQSPLSHIHVARAAWHVEDATALETRVLEMLRSVELHWPLMRALLAWTLTCYQQNVTWRALATGDRLALVWAHAHAVTRVLGDGGMDPAAIKSFFEDASRSFDITDALVEDAACSNDCAGPAYLHSAAVALHGLSYISSGEGLESKLPDIFHRLDALAWVGERDASIPSPAIIMRPGCLTNAMGSFLDRMPKCLVEEGFVLRTREDVLNASVAALKTPNCHLDSWLHLSALAGASMPESLRSSVDASFSELSFGSLARAEATLKALPGLVAIRRRLGNVLDSDFLSKRLFEVANELGSIHFRAFVLSDGSVAARALAWTIRVAAACAQGDAPESGVRAFGHYCLLIAEAWPAAAPSLRAVLDSLLRTYPDSRAEPLWRTFVALRAWP